LKGRMIITTYNPHVRLLSPEPWLVGTTKSLLGRWSRIVMESLRSPTQREESSLVFRTEHLFWRGLACSLP